MSKRNKWAVLCFLRDRARADKRSIKKFGEFIARYNNFNRFSNSFKFRGFFWEPEAKKKIRSSYSALKLKMVYTTLEELFS